MTYHESQSGGHGHDDPSGHEDVHGHDHGHQPPGHSKGLLGALRDVLRPHSHDSDT